MKRITLLILAILLSNFLFAQNPINFSYDNLNRLTKAMYSDSSSINYTYDNNGNRLSKRVQDPCATKPRPVITVSGRLTFCIGDSVVLSTSTGESYLWSTGATAQSIKVFAGGYYSVTRLDTFTTPTLDTLHCYLKSDTTTIVVSTSLPAITGPTVICTNVSMPLTDSVSGGIWTSSNTTIAAIDSFAGIVTGLTSGTATISYSIGGSCYTTSVVTLTLSPPPPIISSVSPYLGAPSSSIIITGSNFNMVPTDNIVYFGATKASVLTASSTVLNVSVPSGATYMPITVDNISCALTGYSQHPFLPTYNDSAYVQDSINLDPKIDFVAGANPGSLIIGDIDGDGKPDIIVTNVNSSTISIFRNTSISGSITPGSFLSKVDFALPGTPFGIALSDLDCDGKLDIVVTNLTGGLLSVFHNNALSGTINTSSLAPRIDFTTPYGTKVAIADIDGDGKPEIIITNNSSSSFSVFHNISSPGFINSSSFAPFVNITTGASPYDLSIADMNGDGKPDVIVSSVAGISVYKNTSSIGSISSASFAPSIDLSTFSQFITGDMDGDGKPDLIVLGSSDTVFVYRNTSAIGSISLAPAVSFTTIVTSPLSIALGDLDGDGKPDVVIAGTGTPDIISVLRNTSTVGSITCNSITKEFLTSGIGWDQSIALGDLDGDGKPDIVAACWYSNTISILRNDPQLFTITPITGNTNVCLGSLTQLSNIDTGGHWYSSNLSVALVNSNTGIVTGVTSGTATISYTLHGSTALTIITVNPTPAIALEDISPVCIGNTTALLPFAATSGSPVTYNLSWSPIALTQGFVNLNSGGTITTFAGNGGTGYSGDGGPAVLGNLSPTGIAKDRGGNLYIADFSNNRIRKVDTSGIITTVAGNGTSGYSGDGGPATSAQLNGPYGVAADGIGNLYITDDLNYRIRKVSTTGIITTIAGNGISGFSGDGGLATDAKIWEPNQITIDNSGNIFFAEYYSNRIRKINTTGIISTVAGSGPASDGGDGGPATSAFLNHPNGVAVDGSGNLYIADCSNQKIRKVNTTGIISTIAGTGSASFGGDDGLATLATLYNPNSVAVDSAGNLYFTDQLNNRVRKISSSGIISTVVGNGTGGFSGDGGPANLAEINGPYDIAIDSSGNLFIADANNNRIRKVCSNLLPLSPIPITVPATANPATYTGTITVSNSGCTSTTYPISITINSAPSAGAITGLSNVCVGFPITLIDTVIGGAWSSSNPSVATVFSGVITGIAAGIDSIRYSFTNSCGTAIATVPVIISPVPSITLGTIFSLCKGDTIVSIPYTSATPGLSYNLTWDSAALAQGFSNIGGGGSIITTIVGNGSRGYSGDGGDAIPAQLYAPFGVAVDSNENVYIADYGNARIRKVANSGIINTIAGNGIPASGGDGGPAINAEIWGPTGVAIDKVGNLYLADWTEHRVRKIDLSGVITTFAGNGTEGFSGDGGSATDAELYYPTGIAVDDSGNVFIADAGNFNNRIRKVNTLGIITTIAGNGGIGYSGDGGPATDATIESPQAVATDDSGNVYIADFGNDRIRKVTTSGIIMTIAGGGVGGDGVAATASSLYAPSGVTVDAQGNVYIADQNNNRIRKVNSLGIISTIAGNGYSGYNGDGGPAILGELSQPSGIAVDKSGNIFISDQSNNCIRKISSSNRILPTSPISISAPGNATPGTYTGLITVFNGTCSNASYPFTVVINPLPSYITGISSVCVGSMITLTDTVAGGIWSSSYPSIATISGGVVTGVAPGVDTIIYSYPTSCGIGTASLAITINPLPSSIIGTMNVCNGFTTTLIDSSGGLWSSSNNTVAKIGSLSGIVTSIAPGTSNITYTLPTGCSANKVVTVNSLPSAITGTRNMCAGSTTLLSDVTSSGVWNSSNSLIATVNSGTGLVMGIAAGFANITYTLPSGCLISAPVIVRPIPVPITGTANICIGLTTTLIDSISGGGWSSNNVALATIDVSGIVTGISAGTPIISYSLPTGCAVTQTVTINPLPAAITGVASVCMGFATTLGDAISLGAWGSGDTTIATVSVAGVVMGLSVGTTNITYALPTACVTTKAITVNPIPSAINGISVVCAGETTTLIDTTLGGNWSSSNMALAGVSGGVVTGVSSGTPVITYSLATGCISTQTVTVNPLPALIVGTTNVCVGSTTTFSDSTIGGTWSSSDTTLATVDTTGLIIGISNGTPAITYTLPTGCLISKSISVNPLPSAIMGITNVCVGSTTTLSDVGDGTWSSSNITFATTDTSTGIITGVSYGTPVVTYMLPTGCVAIETITVNPLPAAIIGSINVCVGLTAALNDTTSLGVWSSSNALATIDTGTGVVTGVASGTSTVTYTLTTGCIALRIITINPIPDVITPLNYAVCNGLITDSFIFSGTVLGTIYNWTNDNSSIGLLSSGTGNILPFIATNATSLPIVDTITITPTFGSCIGISHSFSITVNPTPALTSTLTTSTICDSVLFVYTPTSATPGTTYYWSRDTVVGIENAASGDTGTINESLINIKPYPIAVIYMDTLKANGCIHMQTITVTVNPEPTLSSTVTPPAICDSDLFIYHPVSLTSGTTFTWHRTLIPGINNPAGNGVDTISERLISTSSSPVIVTYVDTLRANGCINIENIRVAVNPLPVISTLTKNVKCFGENSGGVDVIASAGQPPYLYSLNALPFSAIDSFVNLFTGNYIIHVKDSFGCSSQQIVEINQPALPLSATITHNNSTCFGHKNAMITVSAIGGTPPYSYSNDGNTQVSDVFDSLYAGSYVVGIADTNNCQFYDTVLVTQPQQITGLLDSITADDCFPNGSGRISVTATGGTGTIQYSINGANYQTSPVFHSLIATNYTIAANDSNGCIYVFPQITIPETIPENGLHIVLYNGTLISPYSAPCSWYKTGRIDIIDTGTKHTCDQYGNYFVTGIDANGCFAMSDTIQVTGGVDTAIHFYVDPNPADNFTTIKCVFHGQLTVSVKMYDIVGQLVKTIIDNKSLTGNYSTRVETSELSSGKYIIRASIGGQEFIKKLVIVNK